ncbi:transcriptional repressor [Candidatus Poribacteria bacterium]|nr:transcriptional repressor [Candidatus Poribacteria bacterium]
MQNFSLNPKSKYRTSKQRNKILELIKNVNSHPTAEWIYDELKKDFPNLSLATIYRNLKILKKTNTIKELEFSNSFNRYDGNNEQHYHFICKECDNIYDVFIPEIGNLNNNCIKRYPAFTVDTHRLDFFGTCYHCSGKTQKKVF